MKYRLIEICAGITDGSHNPPAGGCKSDYMMISSKNVFDDEITLDDPRYLTEDQFNQENKRTRVASGDVLMTIVGTVGRTAVVPNDFANITLQRSVAVLHPNNDICKSRYLMYLLRAKRHYFESEAHGVAQKGIYLKQLSDVMVDIPEIAEQTHILDILDHLQKVIFLRKQELIQLNEIVKARFGELFDGKYPEDTLLNLCNIIDYRGKTPEKVESGLPFITAKNVKMHHMTLEPREYISKETYDKVMVRGFPKEGDVVFTTEAPLGNVCKIPHFDTEFYIGQRIVTMQTDTLNPTYLEYALSDEEFIRKYMGKSSGSTVTGIRVRLLEQLTIPVPPRALQDEFSIFVNQVDKSKAAVQKSLDETQVLFDSLMQKYFG